MKLTTSPAVTPAMLRARAAEAHRYAAGTASPLPHGEGLHWTERLSWRLVAEEYRDNANRIEAEYAALEAERLALLARLGL